MRVLLAEDDRDTREILTFVLELQGHTVSAAPDGERALQLLRASRFDVVLLDRLMPGIGGDQVLRVMATDPDLRHIPVITISALQPGANDLPPTTSLRKPFGMVELLRTIGQVLAP